jgi:hypothetical protein
MEELELVNDAKLGLKMRSKSSEKLVGWCVLE